MARNPIRDKVPARRSTVDLKNNYRDYRVELEEDFKYSCGYCGHSRERQDPISFHIDHFAPKSKFPEFETDYTNLVFSCRFCNIAKSNKWETVSRYPSHNGTAGFIDPTSPELDKHLYRDETGAIWSDTDLGNYMIKHLKLFLERHAFLWQVRRLSDIADEIDRLIDLLGAQHSDYVSLLESFREITKEIKKYELALD